MELQLQGAHQFACIQSAAPKQGRCTLCRPASAVIKQEQQLTHCTGGPSKARGSRPQRVVRASRTCLIDAEGGGWVGAQVVGAGGARRHGAVAQQVGRVDARLTAAGARGARRACAPRGNNVTWASRVWAQTPESWMRGCSSGERSGRCECGQLCRAQLACGLCATLVGQPGRGRLLTPPHRQELFKLQALPS